MSEFVNISRAFINDIVLPIAENALNLEIYGFHVFTLILVVPFAIWLFESVFG